MIKLYKILFLLSLICAIPIIAMEHEEAPASTRNFFTNNSRFNIQTSEGASKIAEAMKKGIQYEYDFKTNAGIIVLTKGIEGFAGGLGLGFAESMKETSKRFLERYLPTPMEKLLQLDKEGETLHREFALLSNQMQVALQLADKLDNQEMLNELMGELAILNKMKRKHLNKMRKLIGEETEQSINSTNTSLEVTEEENSDSEEESSEDIDDADNDKYREIASKLEAHDVAASQG